MFDHYSVPIQTLSILLVDSILSVSDVIKFNKTITRFNHDISDASIASEEILQVSFPDPRIPKTSDEDASPHHGNFEIAALLYN